MIKVSQFKWRHGKNRWQKVWWNDDRFQLRCISEHLDCALTQDQCFSLLPLHLAQAHLGACWVYHYVIWTLPQKSSFPFYWRDWGLKLSYSPKLTQRVVAVCGSNSLSRFQDRGMPRYPRLPGRVMGGLEEIRERREECYNSSSGGPKVRSSLFNIPLFGLPALWMDSASPTSIPLPFCLCSGCNIFSGRLTIQSQLKSTQIPLTQLCFLV